MPMLLRLSMFALLLWPTAAWAQTVHPIRVLLETTADQARLEIRGLQWIEQRRSVEIEGDVPRPVVEGMTIRKPPFDATPVRLRLDLLVTLSDGPVQWLVTRGLGGTTRLRVEAAGKTILDQKLDALSAKAPTWTWLPDLRKLLAATPPPRTDFGRKVLAFYYGWYGSPQGPAQEWRHWNPRRPDHASANRPQLGWYDSTDPKVVAQHVTWAKEADLQGFVLSWWLRDKHEVTVMRLLLDEAARQGQFDVGLYIESAATPALLRLQVQQILMLFAKHPAYLRVRGKPVIFLYTRIIQDLGNDGLRRALHDLDVFAIGDLLKPLTLEACDGAHTYVSASVPDRYQQELFDTRLAGRLRDKLVLATVMPGYDDTHARAPGGIDHRSEGRFYAGEWAMAALADWVILTSFNEWHEGSEIEPSVELGRTYLDATKRWIAWWRHQ